MSLLSGLGTAVGSILSPILGYKSSQNTNSTNVMLQRETNAQNAMLQRETNLQNQANFNREFEYNDFLNRNQFQIQSEDMKKAGINPLASVSSNLSSFGGSVNTSQASQGQAPQVQDSMLSVLPLVQQALQLKFEYSKLKSDEKIAKDKIESDEKIADSTNDVTREGYVSQQMIAKANNANARSIASMSNDTQRYLARFNADLQRDLTDKNNAVAQAMQQANFRWQDSFDHQQVLRDMRVFESKVEDLMRDKDIARHSITTFDGRTITGDQFEAEIKQAYKDFQTDNVQRGFEDFIKGMETLRGFLSLLSPFGR